MINIIIAEDQKMLCDSLRRAIDAQPDMHVLETFSDAALVPTARSCANADVLLLDARTEHANSGITAAAHAKRLHPDIRTIVMTGMPEITFARQAREAQVDSFLYKDISTEELLAIIRSTMQGYSTYPRSRDSSSALAQLSDDEVAIVRMVCETKTRKEIARELFLSEATVKRRISEILAKTGYDSILKLAVHAVSNGYIAPNLGYDGKD